MESLNLPFFCPEQSWAGNASGFSPSFDVADFKQANVVLNVSFLGGATPTFGAAIETSMDGVNWVMLGTAWNITPASVPYADVRAFTSLLRYIRANGTISSILEEDPGKVFFSLKGIATD